MKTQQFTLILLALLTSISIAQEKTLEPTLIVQVTNATAGGTPAVGDEVTVTVWHHEELITTLIANVNSDGKAVYKNVPTGDHLVASTSVKHQGMVFTGTTVDLNPSVKAAYGQIKVYEVSDDISKLTLETHQMIIRPQAENISITEYIQINNPTDTALTSKLKDSKDKSIVLQMLLPKGFKDLNCMHYFNKNAIVITKDGFYDTMAIPPGSYRAVFTYTLDIDSSSMRISRGITLPTSDFVLFSELGPDNLQGINAEKNQFDLEDGTIGEYFNIGSLSANDKVEFKITGLTTRQTDKELWTILGIVFGCLIVVVIIRMRRKS